MRTIWAKDFSDELRRVNKLLASYAHDRRMLAMLAAGRESFATVDQFLEALAIRESVLDSECGTDAGGKWIYVPSPEETT